MPRRAGLRVVTRAGTSTFYLRGTVKGQRVFESAGTDDRDRAEEARAAREAQLHRAAVYGERPRVAFAAAVLSYLDAEPRSPAMRLALNKLLRALGDVTLDDVTQDRLDRAARLILRRGAKPATRLRQVITPARAVLMHAARRGWCPIPAFERVRAGAARTDWLTPDQAERLCAAATPRARPLFVFLFCTGARIGEAVALDWQDLDLQHGRATLRQTKNGTDRIVELPVRAVATLANLAHRTGRVFRDRAGRPYRLTQRAGQVSYGGQVRKSWTAARAGAGLTVPVTPHHARHTWATWHYAVHRDLLRLRLDGGWATASQAERYAKLAPAGMALAITAFWGAMCAPVVQNRAAEGAEMPGNPQITGTFG